MVWPRPPDIGRIRWLAEFKGETAPPPSDAEKKKQKWMDRLAGKRQIDETIIPRQHILVEPNGIAVDSKGNVYTGEVDTGKRVQRFLVSR